MFMLHHAFCLSQFLISVDHVKMEISWKHQNPAQRSAASHICIFKWYYTVGLSTIFTLCALCLHLWTSKVKLVRVVSGGSIQHYLEARCLQKTVVRLWYWLVHKELHLQNRCYPKPTRLLGMLLHILSGCGICNAIVLLTLLLCQCVCLSLCIEFYLSCLLFCLDTFNDTVYISILSDLRKSWSSVFFFLIPQAVVWLNIFLSYVWIKLLIWRLQWCHTKWKKKIISPHEETLRNPVPCCCNMAAHGYK